MKKQMQKWFDSLTTDEKQEAQQHVSLVIGWGYTVESESGGCKPDPDDTVRLYAESEGVTLTEKMCEYLAQRVREEFR